jgi:putative transposase
MSQFDYQEYYRRNLPHIQPPAATLFVTFRLDGSLPQALLETWRSEKKQLEAERLRRETVGGAPLDPEIVTTENLSFQRRWFQKFEEQLHAETAGTTWLKQAQVAEIVAEALHHRDGKEYRLDAFCIMSNHVHVVFAPFLTEQVAGILADEVISRKRSNETSQTDSLRYRDQAVVLPVMMQSLKGFTARKCNLVLKRAGAFWQHESFDHVVRDAEEFGRTIRYVLQNPVKAGIVEHWQEWVWNYCRPELTELLTAR